MPVARNKKKMSFGDVRPKRGGFPLPERPTEQIDLLEVQQTPEPEILPAPKVLAAPEVLLAPEVRPTIHPVVKTSTALEDFFAAPAQQINFAKPEHKKAARTEAFKKMNVVGQLRTFTVLALICMLALQSAKIIAAGQSTKTVVLGTASQALSQLQEAAVLTSQQQFTESEQQFQLAKATFEQAKTNISNLGPILNSILALSPKGQSAKKLLDAGEAVALAGQNFNDFYNAIEQIHYGASGLDAPGGFAESVKVAQAYLEKGNNYLSVADQNLEAVDPNSLPIDLQAKLETYREDLNQAASGLSQINSLLGLAADFIGNGQKSILVLFENNRELRATGGFIGTYGYFRLNNGKIISQQISSIYDLDGQLKTKIAPPGPFHDLTDHWGLRDSNWFADFPTSAQKASLFYEKEGLETPDAVVAVTPDVIVDLLKVTGPIALPKYGVVLSADNFRDVVQLDTSDLYDKQENTPKQMLADFAPLLMQKLMQTPQSGYIDLVSALLNNLAQKNILIYDRNPKVENQLKSYNWAGAIADSDRDYLDVVSTNLGGRKTDLDISSKINLQSQIQSDGSIINTITYTRTHTPSLLSSADENIDYVRFLVPKGSNLISAQGFVQRQFYPSDGSGYQYDSSKQQPFVTDPDLIAMDKASSIDAVTGTVTTEESGKTEFANWIETKPGDTSTVTIKYKLPFNANTSRKFSLLVQKQPGSPAADFNYNLDFDGHKVLWSEPNDLQIDGSSLGYNTSLKSDIFIGVVLAR